ncbi:MAG TPA: hypothetical protein VFL47_12335, partial [Flavisolibacter sp.]|nr:hypothetical protein [Flavisolibacter sp.]
MAALMTSLPPWILFLLIFIVGVLTAFAGGLIEHRQEKNGTAKKEGNSPSFLGAALGLLAFILGITFSITASRFSDRRHLLVNQANAIGTCYLRTSFLPDQQKRETQRLFRDYIDLLATISSSSATETKLSRLDNLQMQLWKQAVSLKKENMDPMIRSLFITSLNEMIDL